MDGARIWLPELVERFASCLLSNEVACNLRLVDKATAAQFRGRRECMTVRLSEPVPPHAFAHRWAAPDAMQSLTLKQRFTLLRLTAATGSIPNLQVAVQHAGMACPEQQFELIQTAASAGKLEVCQWLLQRGCVASYEVTLAAAKAGQQLVCDFFLAHVGVPWERSFVCAAAVGGHPSLVDWLLLRHPNGPLGPADSLHVLGDDFCRDLVICAAEGCELPALLQLHQRCRRGLNATHWRWFDRAVEAAADSSTHDWQAKLEWLESLMPPREREMRAHSFGYSCSQAAAQPDACSRLHWFRQRGYPVFSCFVQDAAARGSPGALEYMLGSEDPDLLQKLHSPDWSTSVASCAAQKGRLEQLELLRARGCYMNPREVAAAAARCGHLAVLEWAERELGLQVEGAEFLEAAAGCGRLSGTNEDGGDSNGIELMAWLRERGGRWGAMVFNTAADSGCEEALEWLLAQGCPMPADGSPYLRAAANGDLATLRCLRRLGCPWGPEAEVFRECVASCRPLAVLQCLATLGCPVDWAAGLKAAKRKFSRVPSNVKAWLRERLQAQEQTPLQGAAN